MSVEKLIAALEKEAALRETAMMDKASASARAELESAEQTAGEMSRLIEELNRERLKRRENAGSAVAKIKAREARLRAGWDTAELAFQIAGRLYADFMKSPAYAPFIRSKLATAESQIGPVEKASADPATAEALETVNGMKVETDGSARAGFTLYSAGGRVKAEFTFQRALEELWRERASEYYPLLFGEAEDAG